MNRLNKTRLGLLAVALLVGGLLGSLTVEMRHVDPGTSLHTAFAPEAQAQTSSIDKYGTGRVGYSLPCWNTQDSIILSGSLVMADTNTASFTATTGKLRRLGVRVYSGTLSDRKRIIGVAAGNINRSSQGGGGAVLMWGYCPDLKLASSTITGGAPLRVSTVHGAVKDAGDSLSMSIGYAISMTSGGVIAGRYVCQAWIWPTNHAVINAL